MRITTLYLRRAALIGCIPLAFTLGCGDNSTNPTTSDIAGTYTLQSIGGTALPYTFQPDATTTITLTSDVLTIGSDGTWSEAEDFQQVSNGQTTNGSVNDGGTFTLSGSNVTFVSQTTGGTAYTGSYASNTLTLDNGDGAAQVFHR